MAKRTTMVVDHELERLVMEAATKAGIGWATMFKLLAREALAARAAK